MPERDPQINQAQYGVFFDGTGNNYFVDSRFDDDIYEPTNIAKLFELYPQSQSKKIAKHYVNGVGTRDIDLKTSGDKADYSSLEMAFGIGIQKRIDEAIANIREFLEPLNGINTLLLDIFGFSRGAATARIMVNEIHRINREAPETWQGVQVVVRFLGLFDTVGSIGIAGNDKNLGYNLNVHPNAVTQAYQLTAHNESRQYFPLSSLKDSSGNLPDNFSEKALLGAHSDIGGGYGANENKIYLDSKRILFGGKTEKMENQRLARIQAQTNEWKAHWKSYLSDKWKTEDGDIEVKQRSPQKNGPEGQPNSHKQLIRYIWHRKVDKRLSDIALYLMIKQASNSGLPLMVVDTLNNLPTPLEYEIPPELSDYQKAAEQDDELFVEPYLSLYPNFIHHSHQFKPPEGGVGLVNPNATSDLTRQIFYNAPENGLYT